jgi:hypothetical protein
MEEGFAIERFPAIPPKRFVIKKGAHPPNWQIIYT